MSRDLGRDVPALEKLYARKLWADFSHLRGLTEIGVLGGVLQRVIREIGGAPRVHPRVLLLCT